MRENIVRALLRGLPCALLSAVAVIAGLAAPPVATAAQPAGIHPQAVTDQAGLDRLRAARTGDHAWLAGQLQPYLDRYVNGTVGVTGLGAYAIGAEVFQRQDYIAAAKRSLAQVRSRPTDRDLEQAAWIRNVGEAYDLLYNDLDAAERQRVATLLGDAAADMAAAIGREWWRDDFTNNHNWVDAAAAGFAGYVLRGQDARADGWISAALANQVNDDKIGNAVSDGSWHEGVGYQDFMIAGQIPFYLGAALQARTIGDTAMLKGFGRYALRNMLPGHARQQVISTGDWNWVRSGHATVLSYAAARYRDPYAQTAAKLWAADTNPVTAWGQNEDNSEWIALQYVVYDGSVPAPDPATLAKDYYAADQQSALMRTGWGAGDLALGFKNGVFGGRGLFSMYKAGTGPSGYINFGHDHVDDLSLFFGGRGGWLLPEAASYNCCTADDTKYTTAWHNSFLIDGKGQLGDDRNSTHQDASSSAPWFFSREASMPLHASTAHYAFSRGDGTRLYPAGANLSSLSRTAILSRDPGYVVVRDAAAMTAAHRVDALFHSQVSISTATPGWLQAVNEGDRVLGVRVVAPAGFAADIDSQKNAWEGAYYSHDVDGVYASARVHAPSTSTTADFLDVLWPTTGAQWSARPAIQPLDAARPQNGAMVPLADGRELWIFAGGSTTSAGSLTLVGAQVGLERLAADGSLARVAVVGAGRLDAGGRTLLKTTGAGPVEVALSGSAAAVSGAVSGTTTFYGPAVTSVTVNRRATTFTKAADGSVTLGAAAPSVMVTSPASGSVLGASATVTATAGASEGIAGVQFLADGRPIGAEDTTAPYSVALDTGALLTSGVHLISARTRTPSGTTAVSNPVRVTVSAPSACPTATAGQAWPERIAVSASGAVSATAALTPATSGTVGGLGLGEGAGRVWDDLAVSVTFSDDGTVAALDADRYVSSTVRWTAGQTYSVKVDADVRAHTYTAYVKAQGDTAYTQIGTGLRFRTSQPSVTTLDTAAVSAGLGSVRACGITVTTPAHLAVTAPLGIAPGQPTTASFTVTNDGGSAIRVETFVAGNRDAAGANVDFPATAPVTLDPGQRYAYSASASLGSGTYTAWPAAQVGTQWLELAARQTYTVP